MITKTRPGTRGLAMVIALAGVPATAWGSSHREAPLISEDPSADNADLYAFTSPDRPNTVTFIATYIGLEEPGGGPNWLRFADDVLYEIKIDNNGDGRATDVTYEFRFRTHYNPGMAMGLLGGTGPAGTFFYNVGPIDGLPSPSNFHGALVAQTMTVLRRQGGRGTVVGTNIPVAPTYVGRYAYGTGNLLAGTTGSTTPAPDDTNYTRIWNSAVTDLTGGAGRVFAGPTDDPFYVDLGSIFDNVTFRPPGAFGSQGGGFDYVAGYNVHTIALQVPVDQLVAAGTTPAMTDRGNVIGVYATASRPRVTIRRNCVNDARVTTRPYRREGCQDGLGQFVQVSRLGIPLVNEVLIPLQLKDAWNAGRPTDDGTIFAQYILAPSLPTYTQVLYGAMGARAGAGYNTMGLQRSLTDLNLNDMAWLVTGRLGALTLTNTAANPLVNPTGMAPADLLRLHVRTPSSELPTNVGNPTLAMGRSRLGFLGLDTQGFPNGRRLYDDIVDIEERYVLNGVTRMNTANPTVAQLSINSIPFGDGVDGNDVPYRPTFPYVAIPLRGDGLLVHRQEPARMAP
ncbi:MAG: DUF4331 domain-containing protein [Deltaproteobacteria bacterium]|nr:DUF4331 domain-containing protein [Deltaproteobacteria bacterium]